MGKFFTAANSSVARFGLTCAEFKRVTDGDRTRDLRSHNPMLCQLSYGHQAHARFYQQESRLETLPVRGAFLKEVSYTRPATESSDRPRRATIELRWATDWGMAISGSLR